MFPTMMMKMIKEIEKLKKESQSPQIGSMFPTFDTNKLLYVGIYKLLSQSPQIGSMFPTAFFA